MHTSDFQQQLVEEFLEVPDIEPLAMELQHLARLLASYCELRQERTLKLIEEAAEQQVRLAVCQIARQLDTIICLGTNRRGAVVKVRLPLKAGDDRCGRWLRVPPRVPASVEVSLN